MDRAEIDLALRSQPVLAAATAPGLEALSRTASVATLTDAQALFVQGEASDAAYVVLSGAIVISTVSDEGQEVHFADLGPGTLFGELAVLDGGPRTAGATARGPCRLVRIAADAFVRLVRSEPDVALALLRDLCAKLRATDVRLEDRSVLPLEERLAKFLRAEADGRGRIALTQSQIAERVGVSREAVNRRLRALAASDVVRLRRGCVVIADPGALGERGV